MSRFLLEFWHFLIHHKRWWLTAVLLLLAILIALVLTAERPALPPRMYGQ